MNFDSFLFVCLVADILVKVTESEKEQARTFMEPRFCETLYLPEI